ncbi:MAG: VOC family protein [Planktotalea sp.]|uniref:VOC family protein n=1 Tax=Planktotalea sp. TaxID=2029877 RepID=UPI003C70F002
MSQHISAIALVVPDYDAAIAFYVGSLGFDLVEDTQQSANKRWVLVAPKGAQTQLLLAKADGALQTAAIGNQTGGRVGFFLHTEDFASDFQKMRDAGVTFEEEPRVEPYGTVAVFRDPFGNRWDLLELNS